MTTAIARLATKERGLAQPQRSEVRGEIHRCHSLLWFFYLLECFHNGIVEFLNLPGLIIFKYMLQTDPFSRDRHQSDSLIVFAQLAEKLHGSRTIVLLIFQPEARQYHPGQ